MEKVTGYTIRVYGIFMNEGEVLLSDECVDDYYFTKFPGGGLEFGEGTIDTLQREIKEELGAEIQIIKHIYTTDFFVSSAFDPNKQVLSIYYLAAFKNAKDIPKNTLPFNFDKSLSKAESFRWMKLNELKENDLTFPIDKHVLGLLKASGL
jgi:ADP-ribose pyrophosphatase YjhB (NUDIX family)